MNKQMVLIILDSVIQYLETVLPVQHAQLIIEMNEVVNEIEQHSEKPGFYGMSVVSKLSDIYRQVDESIQGDCRRELLNQLELAKNAVYIYYRTTNKYSLSWDEDKVFSGVWDNYVDDGFLLESTPRQTAMTFYLLGGKYK